MNDQHPILVGVDESVAAEVGLAWAYEEARLRHDTLTVMHVYDHPYPYLAGDQTGLLDEAELGRRVRAKFAGMLRPLREKFPDVEARFELRAGPAGTKLVEASADADLLVLASGGHGGLHGTLLGSVSRHVVHHAHCPVVVVRPELPGQRHFRHRRAVAGNA